MNVSIHSAGFNVDEKLESYISKKVGKLETFFDKITHADVYLKLENHEQVKDKVVEIKLNVPGKTIFVAETARTFEESADSAVEVAARQLKRRKEKLKNI